MTTAKDPLADMRDGFRARCLDDLAVLHSAMSGNGEQQEKALRGMVHRLSGIAGSFGFHEVSAMAAALDDRLTKGEPLPPDMIGDLEAALAAIARPRA